MTRRELTGVVLCGGRARRMGGGDKGLLPAAGKPLAQWSVERLAPQVAAVLVNANRNTRRYETLGCPVIGDVVDGFAGPLSGLHAAMAVAQTPWVLSVPCDAPFFPRTLGREFCRDIQDADIAVAVAGGRRQPVFLLARVSLSEDLHDFLRRGGRKIEQWIARHRCIETIFGDEDAFVNLNTPQQLAAAEKQLTINN